MRKVVLEATWIGRKASVRVRQPVINVIGIFTNTIDLVTTQGFIAVTTKNIKSPIYINLDPYGFFLKVRNFREWLSINQSRKIHVKNNTLHLGPYLSLILKKAKLFDPSPELNKLRDNCYGVDSKKLITVKKKFIALSKVAGKTINDYYFNLFSEGALSLYQLLSSNRKVSHMDALLRYLGLGNGLTPTYDDFIGGLVSTTNIIHELGQYIPKKVSFPLNTLLSRTTKVSAYLLTSLSEGDISDIHLNIIKSYCLGDVDALLNYLMDFISLGHDSGLSMGIGILTGLYLASMYKEIQGTEESVVRSLRMLLTDLN